MMQSRIENLREKKLIGIRMQMSVAGNKTSELWQSFMKRRREVQNSHGSDLYSIQLHDPSYFDHFDPMKEFEKWAAIEVTSYDRVPEGMEALTLSGSLYAVFSYKGTPAQAAPAFNYIFREWLPASGYLLDSRPHFEVLGEKYKNNDPDSEEEIWIPIRQKQA